MIKSLVSINTANVGELEMVWYFFLAIIIFLEKKNLFIVQIKIKNLKALKIS